MRSSLIRAAGKYASFCEYQAISIMRALRNRNGAGNPCGLKTLREIFRHTDPSASSELSRSEEELPRNLY